MKKITIAFLLLASLGSTAVMAQGNGAKKEKTAKVKAPKLTFKGGDTHDFGSVKKGPIVYYTFEFTNTGNDKLEIADINPSCGCTNVDWDKQPILPGKKGHIKVGLRTAEQHGNFFKDVYVRSNAANNGPDNRYTIHIKGFAFDDPKDPPPPPPPGPPTH
jgi:hypothetical protein